MSDLSTFRPINASGSGGSASVSGSTATITPTFAPANTAGLKILITNSGTDLLMVEFGANASATTSCPVLPNDKQLFDWVSGGSFAHIGVAGTGSTVYWKLGYGI